MEAHDHHGPINLKHPDLARRLWPPFWGSKSIVHKNYLLQNTTSNVKHYITCWKGTSKVTLEQIGVVSLFYAPIHTSQISRDAVNECGFEAMTRPPFTSDLASSDSSVSKIKDAFVWAWYSNDNELRHTVQACSEGQNSGFTEVVIVT